MTSEKKSEYRVVGHSVPRKDARPKVTGQAQYAVDVEVPGMVHGAVVRSEHPHARILSIDTDKAEAMPGVIRIVTAADFPDLDLTFGHIIRDHAVLAATRTLYQGEPVALVIAETREQARAAVPLVYVDYEELDFVIDGLEAVESSPVELHPGGDAKDVNKSFVEFQGSAAVAEKNVCARIDVAWGDIEAERSRADLIVESEFHYPMTYGYAMEPYCAVADRTLDSLEVWTTTQHPYSVREDLSRVFQLPFSHINVRTKYVGGAYGSKAHAKLEPLAALGSLAVGRPVKIVLSIEESILTTRADSARIKAASGFRADGTILFRDFDIVLNSGAFTDNSPLVANKIAHRCFGPYRIPALKVRVRSAFTNTVPASSLRGFGAPQGVFAGESQIDDAAHRLGLSPAEIRAKNLVGQSEAILPGKRHVETDMPENLKILLDELGDDTGLSADGPVRSGTGFALSASDAGSHPSSVAMVRIHTDGSVTGMVASTELGQGRTTALAQIVAEELGVDFDQVEMSDPDTAATPYERATGASRTTTLVGRALQAACADALSQLHRYACEGFEVADEDVVIEEGAVSIQGTSYTYGEIIQRWFGSGGEAIGVGTIRQAGDLKALPPFWEIGTTGVKVLVDEETGQVTVDRMVTVGDVGFAINPAMTEGQDAGAAMMGLGISLYEELVYEDGHLQNSNIVDYRVPRIDVLPRSSTSILVERRDGVGPYGAKGAGEGAMNPMGASIANAVASAIGARPDALPLTPERVWRLVSEQ